MAENSKPHEMAHADAPTWCRWCGTFDVYCRDGEACPRQDRSGKPKWDMGEFPTVKAEVPA